MEYRVDFQIAARRNIHSRLDRSKHSLWELEMRLRELKVFVDNSLDQYRRTEATLNQTNLDSIQSMNSCPAPAPEPKMNPFMKVWDSIQGIGSDIYNAAENRADHAGDSVPAFLDYLTMGVVSGSYHSAKDRANRMMDSPLEFTNWATLGISGLVDGALFTDDPLSKEHLLNSFGLASLLAGGTLAATGRSSLSIRSSKGETGPSSVEEVRKVVDNTKLKKVLSSGGIDEVRTIIKESSFEHLEPKDISNLFERININTEIDNGIDRVTLQRELVTKALDSGVKTDILVAANNKFINEKGWIKWPDNDGFDPKLTESLRPIINLEKGEVIDRYGGISGKYVSPKYPEISYEQRSLPYMYNPNAYHKYEVIIPIPKVPYGDIAPAFGQSGGGIQYLLPESIEYYLREGYIREVID